MKVFVSWSGDSSREFAVFLERWLKDVIQNVETFISTSDIGIGEDWRQEIDNQLEQNSYGILVLTQENIRSPWLHYEAGALAKTSEVAKLMPVRVGVSNADIQAGPLSKFNNTEATKEGISRLVESINDNIVEPIIEEERLKRTFERWWPEFQDFLDGYSAPKSESSEGGDESDELRDLIGHLASDVRGMSKKFQSMNVVDDSRIRHLRAVMANCDAIRLRYTSDVDKSDLDSFGEIVGFSVPEVSKKRVRKGEDEIETWYQINDLF